jgi:hypothetical protein
MAGERQAERRAAATAARERLTSSLDHVLGDDWRPEPGTRPDYYSDGIVVSGFGLLERCPLRAALPADDYEPSVATARRRVGLLALRRLGDDASPADDVATAVDEVLADGSEWPPKLWEWVDQLDRAGRAAVAAAAITWCTALLRLVGSDARIRWSDPSLSNRWNVPERLVQLTATHEAQMGGVVHGERLLVLADGDGGPGDRLRAGYVALVRALGTQHAPVRVTLAAPSRGELVQVPVDDELLALAVDRVTEHVAHRAAGDRAPVAPGRWCAHCHLLEGCAQGGAHLAATASVRRVGRRAETT